MSSKRTSTDIIPAISAGPFTATPEGLVIQEGQTIPYELWAEYGKGLRRVEGAIQWVIGDWLRFGEFNYGEKYSQATALWPEESESRLKSYQWVANIYPSTDERFRRRNLSFTHFEFAAAVEEPLRSQLLDAANVGNGRDTWSVRELRAEIRRHQIGEIKEAEIVTPDGLYNVISCDPPWPYDRSNHKDPWETYDAVGRRASSPYPERSLLEIAANQPPVADDCILFLWTTHAFMRDAYTLLDLWEFEPKTIITWVKDQMGLGAWLRSKSEFCIMAIKGKPIVALESQTTIVEGPLREHSRKPDEFYAMVDSLVPMAYRKLDMYSREPREGWDQDGYEPNKF